MAVLNLLAQPGLGRFPNIQKQVCWGTWRHRLCHVIGQAILFRRVLDAVEESGQRIQEGLNLWSNRPCPAGCRYATKLGSEEMQKQPERSQWHGSIQPVTWLIWQSFVINASLHSAAIFPSNRSFFWLNCHLKWVMELISTKNNLVQAEEKLFTRGGWPGMWADGSNVQ